MSAVFAAVFAAVLTMLLHVVIWLLSLWLGALCFKTLRYEIHDDEVIVYAGIITKSVKHVPFRRVTNLKVPRGPVERIFGLGSLPIQTAGMSGNTGAEETLAGLLDVQGVYTKVATELRRFRGALLPMQAEDELPPAGVGEGGGTLAELLGEVITIRMCLEAKS